MQLIVQASGAADGWIRLWQVSHPSIPSAAPVTTEAGTKPGLNALGALPARGYVNGLALARDGKFAVAAIGQEPRLGRWLRDGVAKNGTVIYELPQPG